MYTYWSYALIYQVSRRGLWHQAPPGPAPWRPCPAPPCPCSRAPGRAWRSGRRRMRCWPGCASGRTSGERPAGRRRSGPRPSSGSGTCRRSPRPGWRNSGPTGRRRPVKLDGDKRVTWIQDPRFKMYLLLILDALLSHPDFPWKRNV